jgi:DNA invertase Pin-like site-specific DNA recombinase
MVYGYIRVSTDRQTVENQRFEINRFCEQNKMVIDKWFEETVSGRKLVKERELGKVLKKMRKGDVLVCSELSRLGRNLLMIMGVLNECMEREIQVWTIKDNYRLGNDIQCKVLAFAFGLSAEIERNLISQRTKEALARKRLEGVVLGRPVGSKSKVTKLSSKDKDMEVLIQKNLSQSAIARMLGVHRLTVAKYMKDHAIRRGLDANNKYTYYYD